MLLSFPEGYESCAYSLRRVCVQVSAAARGVGVLGLQTFLKATEEQTVPAVLLILAAVEFPLDLKASVHHKCITYHRETKSSYVKLTGLWCKRKRKKMRGQYCTIYNCNVVLGS